MILLALGLLVLVATRASAAPGKPDDVDPEDRLADDEATLEDAATEDDEAALDADRCHDEIDCRADQPDEPFDVVAGGTADDVDEPDDGYTFDPFGLAGTALADVGEHHELALRHRRPSRFGRFDLSIAWRRRWSPIAPLDPSQIAGALSDGRSSDGRVRHTDTFWLTATWRK